MVEIALSPDVPVGFVDRVKKVGAYDEDVDAPPMLYKAWGSGLWFGIAGAYRNAIVKIL